MQQAVASMTSAGQLQALARWMSVATRALPSSVPQTAAAKGTVKRTLVSSVHARVGLRMLHFHRSFSHVCE